MYQTPWKLVRYSSIDALKDPTAHENIKGFHNSKLSTLVGDDTPIKVHPRQVPLPPLSLQ